MQTAASVKTFISRERDESASGAVHSVGALNRLVFPAAGRLHGPEVEDLRGAGLPIIAAGAFLGKVVSAPSGFSAKTAQILSPITRGALEGEIVSARRPQRARDRNRMARANKWGAVATSTNTASSATKTVGRNGSAWRVRIKTSKARGSVNGVGYFGYPISPAPRVYWLPSVIPRGGAKIGISFNL